MDNIYLSTGVVDNIFRESLLSVSGGFCFDFCFFYVRVFLLPRRRGGRENVT